MTFLIVWMAGDVTNLLGMAPFSQHFFAGLLPLPAARNVCTSHPRTACANMDMNPPP